MTKPNNDDIDIYELLSRADELLEEKEDKDFLADPAVFAPETEDPANSPMVYRNAANGYGQNIRNAANHYGAAPVRPQVQPPVPQPARPTQAERPFPPSGHTTPISVRNGSGRPKPSPSRLPISPRSPLPPHRLRSHPKSRRKKAAA